MSWIFLKYLIASLPLVTVPPLTRLHVERQPQEKIANHAWYTLWYVVPAMPMFAAFPWPPGSRSRWPAYSCSPSC